MCCKTLSQSDRRVGVACGACGALNSPEHPVRRCRRCGVDLPMMPQWLPRVNGPATLLLGLLCLVNFAVMVALEGGVPMSILGRPPSLGSLITCGGISGLLGGREQPYRVVSAIFAHLGVVHLAINLGALWILGRRLERQMGSPRLLLAFLLTGTAGFVGSQLFFGVLQPRTSGASGAIFGLLGVHVVFMIRQRDWGALPELLQIAAISAAIALVMPMNNAAHVSGGSAGLVAGAVLALESAPWRHERYVEAAATLGVLIAIVSQVVAGTSEHSSIQRRRDQLQSRALPSIFPAADAASSSL